MVLSLHNELARSEGNDMLSLPRLLKSWIALSSGEANRLDSDLPSLRASFPIWPSLCPSRLRRSLARSRETRFARPNRGACSQAMIYRVALSSV